ncbi:uncharacterized protein PHACADRAFT_148424 [Phanerochaete carnosa HHB-10118-sp]|uniref:Uncharacterized protein n=1 Tax=Phanerochaete carnosa (strain HHB-10118-sp) TaxID=650164 RepID=K5WTB8_PHACS|nr:uncharacterized protein PHACADRAFT_148424 [Phanerochaete carnosa HHB-10118-sp]EKM53677.1 hypothetical protein PHACADRAFT_148424 [Phanerochaete carnosa HHB-10118-sp]
MSRREKTPPPPDDEPKYFTVVHPYPPHANMELLADQKEFAFWIASCTGKEPFLAFFYKPASPNMIIIEVMRNFPNFDRLLGEHRWSEVFQNPAPENRERVSKVFYCKYNTGREVQKYGWKCIFVREQWFSEWNPVNRLISYPYPETHWCAVPPEDATNEPLCRPLPVKDFQPPPKPVLHLPPVGAEGWQEARRSATNGNARKNGAPGQTPKTNATQRGTLVSPVTRRPNAWGSGASPSVLAAPAPEYAAPPGLARPNMGGFSSAWSSSRSAASSAWTVTSAPSRTSSVAGSSTESDGGSIGQTPAVSEYPDRASIVDPDGDDMVSLMESLVMDGAPSEFGTDAWGSGQYAYDQEQFAAPDEDAEENLWADNAVEEKLAGPTELLCKAHGVICKKGICREYARQLRELERKKAEDEKTKAAAERKANKKKAKAQAAPASDSTSSPSAAGQPQQKQKQPDQKIEFTQPRSKPAHLAKAASASSAKNDGSSAPETSGAPQTGRSRPAHLAAGRPGAAAGGADEKTPTARPARGRKMNAAANKDDSTPPSAVDQHANNGRGTEPARDAKARRTGGPPKLASAKGKGKEKKSWADQMEDDDTQSVASFSTNGGWGKSAESTWG